MLELHNVKSKTKKIEDKVHTIMRFDLSYRFFCYIPNNAQHPFAYSIHHTTPYPACRFLLTNLGHCTEIIIVFNGKFVQIQLKAHNGNSNFIYYPWKVN